MANQPNQSQQLPQFQQLCMKQDYQLQYILNPSPPTDSPVLTLRIRRCINTKRTNIYQRTFSHLQQIDKQKILYDSFEDIVNYMRNKDHILVREEGDQEGEGEGEKVQVRILESQGGNVVMGFQVGLFEVEGENQELPIKAIHRICQNQKNIGWEQLRGLLNMVTIGLEKLDQKINRKILNQSQSKIELPLESFSGKFILDQPKQQPNSPKNQPKQSLNPIQSQSQFSQKLKQLQQKLKQIAALQSQHFFDLKNLRSELKQFQKKQKQHKAYEEKQNDLIKSKINKKEAQDLIRQEWRAVEKDLLEKLPSMLGSKINNIAKMDQVNSKLQELQKCVDESIKSGIKKFDKQKLDKLKLSNQYKALDPSKWIDEKSNHFTRLQLKKPTIISKSPANIFSKQKLDSVSCSFTIYIANMKDYIGIGIASTKYKNDSEMGSDLVKYGSNGYFYDGKIGKVKVGDGFKEGEYVCVNIDFKNELIEWKVGGQVRYQQKYEKLRNSKIEWCAYVVMYNADDAIICCSEKK